MARLSARTRGQHTYSSLHRFLRPVGVRGANREGTLVQDADHSAQRNECGVPALKAMWIDPAAADVEKRDIFRWTRESPDEYRLLVGDLWPQSMPPGGDP